MKAHGIERPDNSSACPRPRVSYPFALWNFTPASDACIWMLLAPCARACASARCSSRSDAPPGRAPSHVDGRAGCASSTRCVENPSPTLSRSSRPVAVLHGGGWLPGPQNGTSVNLVGAGAAPKGPS